MGGPFSGSGDRFRGHWPLTPRPLNGHQSLRRRGCAKGEGRIADRTTSPSNLKEWRVCGFSPICAMTMDTYNLGEVLGGKSESDGPGGDFCWRANDIF
jgi:hypothetical protein